MPLQLTEQELSETLDRARQLSLSGDTDTTVDLEPYIHAAEEMGIPRAATIQAFRERNLLPTEFKEGTLVFAPSVDDHWYIGKITHLEGSTARVEFEAGGNRRYPTTDLRPLSLLPGKLVQTLHKDWGWTGSRVTGYNRETRKVEVETNGTQGKYPLDEVRLTRNQANPPTPAEQKVLALNRAALLKVAVWAGGGGLVAGMLLARFLAQLFPFLPFH